MRIAREGGLRELYAGFLPILCKYVSISLLQDLLSISLAIISRQIPYAIGQFTVNEFCHELVFRSVSEETKRTITTNNSLRYGVQLGSGIVAGFAAAILSHVNALASFYTFS